MYSPKWAAAKKPDSSHFNPHVQSRHMSIQMTALRAQPEEQLYGLPEPAAPQPSYTFNPAVAASLLAGNDDAPPSLQPSRRGSTNLQARYNQEARAHRRGSAHLRVDGTGAGGGLDALSRRGTALPTGLSAGMGLQMLSAGRSPLGSGSPGMGLGAPSSRRLSTTPQMHSGGGDSDGPPVPPVAPVRKSVYAKEAKPAGPTKFTLK